MSNPYSPYPTPKKLERSRTNKVLGGVCAGIANYLNMDPTLVRVLWVVISLFTGVPVLLYILALFLLPEESPQSPDQLSPTGQAPQDWNQGYGQAAGTYPPSGQPQAAPAPYGSAPSGGPTDPVWGAAGAPWEQPQPSQSTPPADAGTAEPTPTEPSNEDLSAGPAQTSGSADGSQPADPNKNNLEGGDQRP
jgi:phage shock protein C